MLEAMTLNNTLYGLSIQKAFLKRIVEKLLIQYRLHARIGYNNRNNSPISVLSENILFITEMAEVFRLVYLLTSWLAHVTPGTGLLGLMAPSDRHHVTSSRCLHAQFSGLGSKNVPERTKRFAYNQNTKWSMHHYVCWTLIDNNKNMIAVEQE